MDELVSCLASSTIGGVASVEVVSRAMQAGGAFGGI